MNADDLSHFFFANGHRGCFAKNHHRRTPTNSCRLRGVGCSGVRPSPIRAKLPTPRLRQVPRWRSHRPTLWIDHAPVNKPPGGGLQNGVAHGPALFRCSMWRGVAATSFSLVNANRPRPCHLMKNKPRCQGGAYVNVCPKLCSHGAGFSNHAPCCAECRPSCWASGDDRREPAWSLRPT